MSGPLTKARRQLPSPPTEASATPWAGRSEDGLRGGALESCGGNSSLSGGRGHVRGTVCVACLRVLRVLSQSCGLALWEPLRGDKCGMRRVGSEAWGSAARKCRRCGALRKSHTLSGLDGFWFVGGEEVAESTVHLEHWWACGGR